MNARAWVVLLFATGCATTGAADFVATSALKFDPAQYPEDAALVLFRADHTELVESGSEDWTHHSRHEVIAVLGEGGFDLAEVKVPLWAKSKLLRFNARVVQPDGTEQRFDGAQLLSDASGKGELDSNAKFFRFADVRVGSVLEYAWTVESPGLWSADDQDTLGSFPVRRYEFELTATKALVLETIEFNGGSPIQVRTLGDGRHQLRFELQHADETNDAFVKRLNKKALDEEEERPQRTGGAHNPKVVGSNPTPATNESAGEKGVRLSGTLLLSVICKRFANGPIKTGPSGPRNEVSNEVCSLLLKLL